MEDKEGFVRAPSTALAEFGGSRYDWLRDGTLTYYIGRGGEEFVDVDDAPREAVASRADVEARGVFDRLAEA